MNKLLLILLCLPIIGFGQTWEIEYLSNGYDLNTVYFYNDTIGYAVGDNGAMIKTTNAGDNWIDLNCNTTNDITDVMFISEDTGYICTKGGVYTQTHGEILITYNGGNNWTQLYQGSISGVYQSYFKIEKIINGDITIIGYENWINSNNTSISYGRRFNYQTSTNIMNQSNVLMNGGIPYDSYLYSSNSYTLVGGNGMPLGGASWTPTQWIKTNISGININVNFPTGWGTGAYSSLYSIDMLDANPINGVTVGSDGKIYNLTNMTSVNNIITENSSFANTTIDLWSVEMMNDKGWIVGDLGTILFTVDSGQTWNPYNNLILFEDLHSVVFIDPCKGYFVGENGVVGRYRYEENVSISLCENSQNLSLFSLLDSNAINLGGVWTDSSGNSISPNIDPSTLALGIHSFYYSFYLCNEVKTSVVNISIYEVPDLSTIVLNNVLCSGDNTGSAQVNMLNGSIIYANCLWSNGSNNAVASNLLAGSYTVSVTDTNGCSANTSVTITQPSTITPIITITNATCYGGNDASIVETVTGGVPPFQYSLGGGLSQSNGTFSNLTAGTYFIDVTDINGCSSNQTVIITEPNPLFVNAFSTDISCFGYCDGSAFSMPSGGTPPYSYLWSNGNITDNISGLCAGAYVVNITDANNCVNIETVLISEPLPLVSNNTINGCDSVLIGGNYYTISGAYTDTLTSVNGCDSVVNTNLTIEQNTSSYDTLSVTASIVWNGIPLNVSGDYSVTLINSLGCDSIVNLNLTVTTTGISDIVNNKSNLVKITDMLGQETPYRRNTPLFYIYDDGTVEKRIVIE
jgi:photosystem II stability/assembly factor-like uncharacterized protein